MRRSMALRMILNPKTEELMPAKRAKTEKPPRAPRVYITATKARKAMFALMNRHHMRPLSLMCSGSRNCLCERNMRLLLGLCDAHAVAILDDPPKRKGVLSKNKIAALLMLYERMAEYSTGTPPRFQEVNEATRKRLGLRKLSEPRAAKILAQLGFERSSKRKFKESRMALGALVYFVYHLDPYVAGEIFEQIKAQERAEEERRWYRPRDY